MTVFICGNGSISAIPSKSQAHRYLICAAFSDKPTDILCPVICKDIEATVDCLQNLGAKIVRTISGYHVIPAGKVPDKAHLCCGESGSTLRFLLPIVGALGIDTSFYLEGRLPQRPLLPLWKEMERMGCSLKWQDAHTLHCCGQLHSGEYRIPGNISSQFITGLLFASALISGQNKITIVGKTESRPYVDMTISCLLEFGFDVKNNQASCGCLRSPGYVAVEGDWSNGGYLLAANALGSQVDISGLNPHSCQGDRIVLPLLKKLQHHTVIDAADIPDLIPILAVTAAANSGAVFINIGRLRMKESNRIESVIAMLRAIGDYAESTDNTLTVYPCTFRGGTIDAYNDHRIAMAAAIAATVADGPVTVIGAECVQKSYPGFWKDYHKLGGNYEQHLR